MKWWRSNKKQEGELPSFLIAGLIRCNRKLISWANFLQEKTNHYSSKKKKILLVFFIMAFLTSSLVVMVRSFKQKDKTSIAVTRIQTIGLGKIDSKGNLLTQDEFLKIQQFKNYVDSISITPGGGKIVDSLLHHHPGFMDSVNLLINLYLEQIKSK